MGQENSKDDNEKLNQAKQKALEYFNKGCELFEAKKYSKALEKFKSVEKQFPGRQDYQIFYFKALCFIHMKKMQEAIECYKYAVVLKPEDSSLFLLMEKYYIEEDNEEKLETFYRECNKANEKDRVIAQKYFDNLVKNSNIEDEAIRLVKSNLISFRLASTGTIEAIFRKFLDEKDYQGLADFSEECLKQSIDYKEKIYLNLGFAYKHLEKYLEGQKAYEKCIELNSNPEYDIYGLLSEITYYNRDNEASIKYGEMQINDPKEPLLTKVYYQVASCYYNIKKYTEALKCLDEGIQKLKESEDFYNSKTIDLMDLKTSVLKKLKYPLKEIEAYKQERLSIFEEIAIKDPSENNLVLLAEMQTKLGKYKDSLKTLEKCEKIAKDEETKKLITYWKVENYMELGFFDKALEICKNSTSLRFGQLQTLMSIGKCYFYMENYKEAEKYFDEVISKNEKIWTTEHAINYKGYVLQETGKPLEAIPLFEKILELNPDNLDLVYHNVGNSYAEEGDLEAKKNNIDASRALYEKAIEYYQKAYDLDNDRTSSLGNISSCLRDLGRYDEAIVGLNKCIEEDPEDSLNYWKRARIQAKLNCVREAVDDMRKAYDLVQENGWPVYVSIKTKKELQGMEGELKSLVERLESVEKTAYNLSILEVEDPEIKQEIQKLNKMKDEAIEEAIDDFNQPRKHRKSVMFEQKLQAIATAIQKLESETKQNKAHTNQLKELVSKHEEVLQLSGAYDLAKIKKGYQELEKENIKLYNYSKTLYWTLFNYFSAYRVLSTQLVDGNPQTVAKNKERYFIMGIKSALKIGAAITENIPFVGSIISGIESCLTSGYSYFQELKFDSRVNIITNLVINQADTDQELSAKIALASLNIAKLKKEEILNFKINSDAGSQNSMKKGAKKLRDKISQIVDKMKGTVAEVVKCYEEEERQLALQDVTLLLAFLYINHSFLDLTKELDEQLSDIVVNGKLNDMGGKLRKKRSKTSFQIPDNEI